MQNAIGEENITMDDVDIKTMSGSDVSRFQRFADNCKNKLGR